MLWWAYQNGVDGGTSVYDVSNTSCSALKSLLSSNVGLDSYAPPLEEDDS